VPEIRSGRGVSLPGQLVWWDDKSRRQKMNAAYYRSSMSSKMRKSRRELG